MDMYDRIIPNAVIEPPYQLSMINLYNNELQRIWQYGCKGSECDGQDIDKAAIVDQAIKV